MEFIKFTLSKKQNYLYEDSNSIFLNIVGRFLRSDAFDFLKSYKAWINDDISEALGGNITTVYKENNTIILNELYSEEDDGGPFLEIPKEEFIKILDEWEKICKEKPREVMIIKEGDTYRFETKN